jgi:hypothetical protein
MVVKIAPSDLEAVWRARKVDPSNTYLDRHIGLAIAEMSERVLIWQEFDCIFCAANKIPADEDLVGIGKWSLPVLIKKRGYEYFTLDHVSNEVDTHRLGRMGLAFIPQAKYSLGKTS